MPNPITIFGNLGADAEQAQAGNTPVVRWRVASTSKGRNGAPDHTAWYSVTIWRGWDSHAAARKGDSVTVAGELTTREYDGKMQLDVSAQPWTCRASRSDRSDRSDRAPQQTRSGDHGNTSGSGWGGGERW
jgi:single-stranded DNA-binding protein